MDPFEQRLRSLLSHAYDIERELGAGGVSRVFVATDRSLGRKVRPNSLRCRRAVTDSIAKATPPRPVVAVAPAEVAVAPAPSGKRKVAITEPRENDSGPRFSRPRIHSRMRCVARSTRKVDSFSSTRTRCVERSPVEFQGRC